MYIELTVVGLVAICADPFGRQPHICARVARALACPLELPGTGSPR